MQHIRQELMSSAFGHARRARRTTGRLVVSALGFGVAYYFDAENGGARREQLRRSLRRTAAVIDAALAPGVEEPPVVFTPLLQALRPKGSEGFGGSEGSGGYDPRLAQLAQRAESN